jgi:hypothetical protein
LGGFFIAGKYFVSLKKLFEKEKLLQNHNKKEQ